MTSRKFPIWIWVVSALTAILSLYSIYKRHEVEASNHSVAIAVEMDNVQSMAASQGITVPAALSVLKRQGLRAVVVSEDSVASLISEGRAAEIKGKLTVLDPTVQARVLQGEAIRMNGLDPSQAPVWYVRSVLIGINPDEAKMVTDQGMIVIARCSNVLGATDSYIKSTLGWAHQLGATVFLPEGDQVLGRRDDLKTTVETLKQLNMMYATAEFAKISGDDNVVQMAPEIVVRLHAAQNAELDKMSVDDVVERYSKAARERNMRILLVRPMSLAGGRPVDDFGQLINAIKTKVEEEGGTMGRPQPYHDAGMPRFFPVLIALTVVPVAYWIGLVLIPATWGGPVCGVLMLLLALAGITKTGAQLGSLAASMAFPTAAMLSLDMRRLGNILGAFLSTTALSLVGGLAIAGMLNALPYYVRAETFPGVKVSVFIPLAIVAIYYFFSLTQAKDQIRSPITWFSALLGLVTLGALAFMIARTGNDSPTGVSGTELAFRNILDQILPVRPRTKEFLIGHPALLIGLGLLAYIKDNKERMARLGSWTTLALMVGAMGQTSIVNTLCHLHTPVYLSLMRIAEGVVLGSIIGLVLWMIVKRLVDRTPTNA